VKFVLKGLPLQDWYHVYSALTKHLCHSCKATKETAQHFLACLQTNKWHGKKCTTNFETIGQKHYQCYTPWLTSIWAIYRMTRTNTNMTGTKQCHTAPLHSPTPTQLESIVLWLLCTQWPTICNQMHPNINALTITSAVSPSYWKAVLKT